MADRARVRLGYVERRPEPDDRRAQPDALGQRAYREFKRGLQAVVESLREPHEDPKPDMDR